MCEPLTQRYTCPVCEQPTVSITRSHYTQEGRIIPHSIPCFEIMCWTCSSGGQVDIDELTPDVESALVVFMLAARDHPEWREQWLATGYAST